MTHQGHLSGRDLSLSAHIHCLEPRFVSAVRCNGFAMPADVASLLYLPLLAVSPVQLALSENMMDSLVSSCLLSAAHAARPNHITAGPLGVLSCVLGQPVTGWKDGGAGFGRLVVVEAGGKPGDKPSLCHSQRISVVTALFKR